MKYVTFNPGTRELTGAYIQPLRAEHANFLEVSDEEHANWVNLRMNAELTGTEPVEPVDAGEDS